MQRDTYGMLRTVGPTVAMLALAFVVGGCEEAHSVPAAHPARVTGNTSGAAQVCVVRPERMATEQSMTVHDNGRLVGATRGATYVCWLAAPGEHQLTSIDDDTGPMLLEARVGTSYWIHQEVSALDGVVHAHLDWVDEETAQQMIAQCDDRVRVAVPGHDDEDAAMAIAPAATQSAPHGRATVRLR